MPMNRTALLATALAAGSLTHALHAAVDPISLVPNWMNSVSTIAAPAGYSLNAASPEYNQDGSLGGTYLVGSGSRIL